MITEMVNIMCVGVALVYSELPLLLMDEHGLDERIFKQNLVSA